jgi:Na+-transporting NADH:ubiquinone oxidoreductase subunit NqrC
MNTILALVWTQSETPGLGAEIETEKFHSSLLEKNI